MVPIFIFRMKDESMWNTDGMTIDRVKPRVMNVKFWKILVRLRHVATARWRWRGFLRGTQRFDTLHRMPEQTILPTLIFPHNPTLQDNWPHSHYLSLRYTWRKAFVSLRRNSEENDYCVFKICMASICTRLVVLNVIRILQLHLELSALSWAYLSNVIWLFI
jgi:hypothetical protein